MATITHRTPGFTGTEIILCTPLVFVDGVAEQALDAAQAAAVTVRGHRVDTSKPKPKRGKAKAEPDPVVEIGQDVPVTEQEPPSIG